MGNIPGKKEGEKAEDGGDGVNAEYAFLSELSIEESVAEIREEFYSGKEPVSKEILDKFPLWMSLMNQSLNLCLYGVGSKTKAVEAFVNTHFSDSLQIKIKGWSSSVKVENIFMKILQTLEVFANSENRSELSKLLSMKKPKPEKTIGLINNLLTNLKELFNIKLLVVFLDMDGKHFREAEAHECLSQIFKHEAIQLIGTFSNVNFTYLLSQEILISYNLIFCPCHTYEPNEIELIPDEIYWFNKKQSKGANAIWAIYQALTDAQKEVLKLLAETILKKPNAQVGFKEFYEVCEDEMIVSNEGQLLECLKEAISHGVVIEKIGEHSQKYLKMPNAAEALNVFSKDPNEEEGY